MEKTHTKNYKKREYSDGRYPCANRIIVEEGGGRHGKLNAANYALRCLAMGRPWAPRLVNTLPGNFSRRRWTSV
eukprot:2759873-Pyramimonas_sp.AAC.1